MKSGVSFERSEAMGQDSDKRAFMAVTLLYLLNLYLFACLSVCLFVCLLVCLFVCLVGWKVSIRKPYSTSTVTYVLYVVA